MSGQSIRPSIAAPLTCAALVAGVLALAPSSASAQASVVSLGGIIGGPTGLSLMVDTPKNFSVHAAVGFGWLDDDGLLGQADLLWHRDVASFDRSDMSIYFGVGPRLGVLTGPDEVAVGAHAPFGMQVAWRETPVEFFVEVALGLWVVPDVDLYPDAALGARYRF